MVLACGYSHMGDAERRLAQKLTEDGNTIARVAVILGRDHSTVRRNLEKAKAPAKRRAPGRPRAVTPRAFQKLMAALNFLLKQSKGQTEVTAKMVMRRAGSNLSEKTVRAAFHERGVWFRKLKEKPILTPQDVADRKEFAEKHVNKSKRAWLQSPHAIIDNKHFPLHVNRAGREHAARRSVRGAYRSAADGLKPHLVKPKGTLKFPAKSVQVTAAVVKGRVRMWHYVTGRWNGEAAAEMYKGPLLKTLKRAFPGKRSWVVMEDNDPAGYQSRKGAQAKEEAKLVSLRLPKRSPDCNVLDYSLWKEINTRTRAQEQTFPAGFVESEQAYLKRLRRTALGLPEAVVSKAVGDMRRRMQDLVDNGGGLIKE